MAPAGSAAVGPRVPAVVLLCFAFVNSLLFAGVVFGWPSCAIMLKNEGAYASLCPNGTHVAACEGSDCPALASCDAQDKRLVFVYNCGVFSLFFSRLFVGILLDRRGPRVCAVAGGVIVAVGSLLFALSSASPGSASFDAFAPAMFLLSVGGTGIHFANFHLANLFPVVRRTLISAFSGVFSVSGMVFYIFLRANDGGIARRTLFLFYGGLALGMAALSLFLQPKRQVARGERVRFTLRGTVIVPSLIAPPSIALPANQAESKATPASVEGAPSLGADGLSFFARMGAALRGWKGAAYGRLEEDAVTHTPLELVERGPAEDSVAGFRKIALDDEDNAGADDDAGDVAAGEGLDSGSAQLIASPPTPAVTAVAEMPLLRQVRTWQFGALLMFFSLGLLQMQFLVATARDQLERKGDTHNTRAAAFNVIGALGFVALPITGAVLDGAGGFPAAFGSVCVLSIAYNLVNALASSVASQYAVFVLWSVMRFFLFSAFFAYVADEFGPRTFGTVAGIVSLAASLFALLTYPLNSLVLDTFHGSFAPVHEAFAVMMGCLAVYPVALWIARRRRKAATQ